MIRLTLVFATLFTVPALAAPTCPTKADAISPGVRVTFDDGSITRFTVSKDGKVTEDLLDDEIWRYEAIESVFLLRFGPMQNGALIPEEIEVAEYQAPLDSLPAMADGIRWQGHVSYSREGVTTWETDMMVVASSYPDLHIGDCTYKATLLAISETDEEGAYTSFLAFLPELGFGLYIGTFSGGQMEEYAPVSIELAGDG